MNPFIYSDDNKRYHTLNYYNRHHFGKKIHKAAINAGFTCPNIDGTRGVGGCIFCSGGSHYFAPGRNLSITEQLDKEISRIRKKDSNCGIIAYFQANSNTYAPVEKLEQIFSEALNHPDVTGLSIATRPDCLPSEVIDLLKNLSTSTNLSVELGLQTIHDISANAINRCHSYKEFLHGYTALKEADIRTCVHIINGLPGENGDMMLETALELGKLRPDAVKIHLMHIIKGTGLEKLYSSGQYMPLTMEEYIDIVVNQLELLPAETVIERITGDGDKRTLLAPDWSRDKIRVLGSIDKLQSDFDTYQGKKACG